MRWAESLAQFVSGTSYLDIPPEVLATARSVFMDCLGGTVAGSQDPGARIIQEQIKRSDCGRDCTLVGTRLFSSLENAALANGVAAHILDIDDTSRSMDGHASISVLPVCLALAEMKRMGGADVLTSFIVGFEIQGKLGSLFGPSLREAGWHSAGVFGTLGATAAAANMIRLDPPETIRAMGIAASLASGLSANIGSMVKSLHAGNSARNGVLSAMLAKRGFDSQPQALSGFLSAFSANERLEEEALTSTFARLGKPFDICDPGTDIKLYPSCNYTHPSIDAALDLLFDPNFSLSRLASVNCIIGSLGRVLLRRPPLTGVEAKFSVEFCIACALTHGNVEVDHFCESEVERLSPLMRRIQVMELNPNVGDPQGGPATLTIAFEDGSKIEATVNEPKGSVSNPLSIEEIERKYNSFALRALRPEAVEESLVFLQALEEQSSLGPLMNSLSATIGNG